MRTIKKHVRGVTGIAGVAEYEEPALQKLVLDFQLARLDAAIAKKLAEGRPNHGPAKNHS